MRRRRFRPGRRPKLSASQSLGRRRRPDNDVIVSKQDSKPLGWRERLGSVSVDWWATLLAGGITALAVANVLPKIPW
ncbi:hypothetical protein A5706_24320 [Mycobacterium sp. E796]|nr:hypothetical protein A5706_24320 [Mycobacterium sp. E796]